MEPALGERERGLLLGKGDNNKAARGEGQGEEV